MNKTNVLLLAMVSLLVLYIVANYPLQRVQAQQQTGSVRVDLILNPEAGQTIPVWNRVVGFQCVTVNNHAECFVASSTP